MVIVIKIKALIFLSLVVLFSCSEQDNFSLSSPNGAIQVIITNKDKSSTFSVIYAKDTILNHSTLGLQVNKIDYAKNVAYADFTKTEFDETWTTVIGKKITVRNHYNEYKFSVAKTKEAPKSHEIIFRLYDDGFAYRYHFLSAAIGDSIMIDKELTALNIKGEFTYWAYNGKRHNIGPVVRSAKRIKVQIPLVLQLENENFMAIHEAEIVEFAPFSINASINNKSLGFNTSYSNRKQAFKTSWRTFMIGHKIGDLVESNLLENLNEPCKIADPSWIKPGKSLWDWRVLGYKTDDAYTYQLNTASHKILPL